MVALGEPLIQIGASQAPNRANRVGKVVVFVSLLLGFNSLTFWMFGYKEQQAAAEEPATSMAIAQPMRQPMNLRQPFQQAQSRYFMRAPVQASQSPIDDVNSQYTGQLEPVKSMTKREMMGAAAASAAATLPFAANAQEVTKREVRPGLLIFPVAIALGWVGFNILGPALNQLDEMGEKAAAPTKKRR
jgi:hypothetical protein